jgi:hypothetical protein
MLLQTNSYVVPKEKRAEHVRLLARFRQTLAKFGCDDFEVFEQSGSNWTGNETTGRYVQMIRFRDKKHHMEVQTAERTDPMAQKVIAEFCELINFPYQQQQGLFAVGFYTSVLDGHRSRRNPVPKPRSSEPPATDPGAVAAGMVAGGTAAAVTAGPVDPATEILDEGIEDESGIAGRIGPAETTHDAAIDNDTDSISDVDTDVDIHTETTTDTTNEILDNELDLESTSGDAPDVDQLEDIDIDLDLADSNTEDARR